MTTNVFLLLVLLAACVVLVGYAATKAIVVSGGFQSNRAEHHE